MCQCKYKISLLVVKDSNKARKNEKLVWRGVTDIRSAFLLLLRVFGVFVPSSLGSLPCRGHPLFILILFYLLWISLDVRAVRTLVGWNIK